jgi:hypothetical protein
MRNLIRLTALAGATAGTLVLVGGIASAAPAPTLSGSYTVAMLRTFSQGLNNQPPTTVPANEPWRILLNSCTTASCTTPTLNWTGLSGKLYQYKSVLTQDVANNKPLHYSSAHTFLQTCRGHHGAHIAQGWSASQSINIVGSHVTAGRIDKFKATITTTYTPTPLGAGGGCNAAKEVLTGAV